MSKFEWLVAYIVAVFLLALIALPIGYTVAAYNNEHVYVAKVTDKEAKKDGDDEKYLVFTKVDGETKVFENTDALFAGKFDSSDMYADIQRGKIYKFKTIGFRIPFLSSYENIIKISEVK
jgi:hypothetical protein